MRHKYEQIIEDLKKENEIKIVELKEYYKKIINEIENEKEKRTITELRLQNEKLLTAFEKLAS
jgi:hypothetical protein